MQLSLAQLLVERYGRFLVQERALEVSTARRYEYVAGRFLAAACSAGGVELSDVDAATVGAHLTVVP